MLFMKYSHLHNISLVVEFQRWWVLKSKLFGQESTCHQGIFQQLLQVMTVRQKVPKSYFQSEFSLSRIFRILVIFFAIENNLIFLISIIL